jgi:hypothetical protein
VEEGREEEVEEKVKCDEEEMEEEGVKVEKEEEDEEEGVWKGV